MIRILKSKDYTNFITYCQKRDVFSDFYVLKENKRFYLNNIKSAKKVFNNCLKHGDKCIISERKNIITGILLVTGYSTKEENKYIKIIADKNQIVYDLLKVFGWKYQIDSYIKAKKINPIIKQAFKLGFRVINNNGRNFTLYRKFQEKRKR